MSEHKTLAEIAPTRAQRIFISWTKDVLIYLLVLNLFVEYSPVVVIDSFTISIFTAILLKALLDIILWAEHKVAAFFEARSGPLSKFFRILFTWLILFFSKFLILEVVDIVFGEHVELGKFLDVIFLVLVMMIAREVFQRIYLALGKNQKTNNM